MVDEMVRAGWTAWFRAAGRDEAGWTFTRVVSNPHGSFVRHGTDPDVHRAAKKARQSVRDEDR